MKKTLLLFAMTGIIISISCKKDDSGKESSSTTTTTTSSGSTTSTTSTTSSTSSTSSTSTTNNQNYTIDDFAGEYDGTIKETTTLSSGETISNTVSRTFRINKTSATTVSYSTLEGNFENGRIVFPKQSVMIGSYEYEASGTGEMLSTNQVKMNIALNGSSDDRVQEINGTK